MKQGMNMEKQNRSELKFPTRMSMIRYFLKGSTGWFMLSMFCMVMVSFLELLSPKIIQFTIDSVIDHQVSVLPSYLEWMNAYTELFQKHMIYIAFIVLMVALAVAVLRYGYEITNAVGSQKLIRRMHDTMFAHLLRLPFSWYQENAAGDVLQRSTSDCDTVQSFLAEQMTTLLQILFTITLATYYMFRLNVRMAIFSFLFLPLFLTYSLFFYKRVGNTFEKMDEEEAKLSSITQENLTGIRVVRAFGREAHEKQRFEAQNEIYSNAWIRLLKILAGYWSSIDFLAYLQALLIILTGVYACIHGSLTVGGLVAFVSYNAMFIAPVRTLGRRLSQMSRANVAMDRIREVMNAPEEQDESKGKRPPMNRDIVFNHVHFAYDDVADVLKDVSFTVKAGTTVGILGATGSGKSTILYLLDRLYPLTDGSITIDGVDIREIDRAYLRTHIGLVLQDPFLFSRTLGENIRIARPSGTMDAVMDAADAAALSPAIAKFSKGYDTFVGERGVTLSGGQKQRTAIAQMLVRQPEIMAFDDSLSAVDAKTDALIRAQLKKRTGQATVFLIAHRIATLMDADQILVLDHGQIVERGSHEELLAKNGIYAHIYRLQKDAGEGENNGTEA